MFLSQKAGTKADSTGTKAGLTGTKVGFLGTLHSTQKMLG
jgi:hypothetical protein